MSNAIFGADFVDPHGLGIGRVAAAWLFTFGCHCPLGRCGSYMVLPPVQSQEIPKLLYDLLFLQVASPQIFWWANGHKELRLAFVGTKLRDLDMEIANGVSFEFLPLWLIALPIRQPRSGVRLQKAMQ